MTSLIDNLTDELIARVRLHRSVSDMVFVTAYPPQEAPDPVSVYTVAVTNTGVKRSQVFVGNAVGAGIKGYLYDVQLVLRTYAPRGTASFALLRKTALLADALEASDADGAIAAVSLGGISAENGMRSEYRDLHLTLRWLIGGEGAR